ncbi:MAG TPA: hypothetical protein VHB97_16850 [Polyangia bacterium]|nr:hypothetical protein [Polyangia bacterium]
MALLALTLLCGCSHARELIVAVPATSRWTPCERSTDATCMRCYDARHLFWCHPDAARQPGPAARR